MKSTRHRKSIPAALALALTAALLLGACSKNSAAVSSSSAGSSSSPAGASASQSQVSASSGGSSAQLFTLRTSTKKNCSSTPWVVGEAKGIFAKYGIKIEYTGELNEGDALPALLSGKNDVEGDFPGTIAKQVAQGGSIIGVGFGQVDPDSDSISRDYQHMAFYVSPKLGVKSLDDLKKFNNGGKITISGVGSSNCLTFIPQQVFKHNGLDPARLSFVGYDSDTAAIQLVQEGKLDIAGIHPPFYYLAAKDGLTKIFDSRDSGLGAATGAVEWYFRKDFIAQHSDVVQHFIDAITESQAWGLAHPDEAKQLTGEYIGQKVNAVHYFYNGSNVSGGNVDAVAAKLIQPWLDDLVSSKVLKKDQVKVSDVFDPKYVENLHITAN